jgi:pSer/pThr/pTyr-binding forkhead associated (FHA) protein
MNVYLEVTNGARQGQRIALPQGEFLVGRGAECHLRPGSAAVSKRHCALRVEAGRLFVRDLGSANGTKVNSCRVEGDDFELRMGDLLEIGPLAFVVQLPAPSERLDDDAIAAILRDSPEAQASGPVDTVVDGLTGAPTAVDLPGGPAAYRPGSKPAEDKGTVNSAQAASDLLEQYRRRRRSKEP